MLGLPNQKSGCWLGRYKNQSRTGGCRQPRKRTQYQTCHNRLLEFLGHDQMIHTFKYEVGRDYKNILSNTITNRGTKMSTARVDLYLGYASQLFNWAIKHHFFWNLLSSGFGYETNIAGIGAQQNLHFKARSPWF